MAFANFKYINIPITWVANALLAKSAFGKLDIKTEYKFWWKLTTVSATMYTQEDLVTRNVWKMKKKTILFSVNLFQNIQDFVIFSSCYFVYSLAVTAKALWCGLMVNKAIPVGHYYWCEFNPLWTYYLNDLNNPKRIDML